MNTPDPIEVPTAVSSVETSLHPETEKIKARFVGMSTEAAVVKSAVTAALSEVVADWLIGQFAMAAQARLDAAANEIERWEILRVVALDLCRLRRGDHSAGWLALQRAKWEEEIREVTEARLRRENPNRGLTMETIRKIERELNLLPSEEEFSLWKQTQGTQESGSKGQAQG